MLRGFDRLPMLPRRGGLQLAARANPRGYRVIL